MIRNALIWAFWAKKYQLSNLNKISHVAYFKGADFKFDIGFRKFWNAQVWAFWAKKYQLSNLNEILPVSNFKGADFKFDFRFRKFWNFITSLIKIVYFVF